MMSCGYSEPRIHGPVAIYGVKIVRWLRLLTGMKALVGAIGAIFVL